MHHKSMGKNRVDIDTLKFLSRLSQATVSNKSYIVSHVQARHRKAVLLREFQSVKVDACPREAQSKFDATKNVLSSP
jgi:hypothetical protein